VLIPSIDLMGGKIVQLIQGEHKALEFSDFEEWIERFAGYSIVQLIDLDAAIGSGSNHHLLKQFTSRLPCQVGGGIRSVQAAQEVLAAGARKVIVGSALAHGGQVNTALAAELARSVGAKRVIAAVDSRGGRVVVSGWRESTGLTSFVMMRALEPHCAGFLYTHVDTEGLLQGIPFDVVHQLRSATQRKLIVAGGIRSQQEVDALDRLGVDAVVGMAIYAGLIKA
jgi:phosphoribosylformimino-5-aminoimidazole carboxamide ribotide isomerase